MHRSIPRCAALVWLLLLSSAAAPARAGESPITTWIQRNAKPFDTCEPRDDHHDLASLRSIVGHAHVVALGEGTHGTREFFQLKHRIVEYLASEMGFTTFAIEANLPEAWRLNDYVLTGRGDPKALIAGMYFWTWNTEEVLEFVQWMRRFNASGRGRMQFVGFDMQTPDTAAAIVGRFLERADPAWADSAAAVVSRIRRARQASADFVTATGAFPVKDAAGHHVRFSGWIRTENVTDFAGLWWRADVPNAHPAFDNMQNQRVNGTRAWKRCEIALDVPANTNNINFGMLMAGTGRAWFDSLAIEIDGKPWTGSPEFDLALDSPEGPTGFSRWAPPGYRIAMEDSAAAAGRRSLCLSGTAGLRPGDAAPQWRAAEATATRLANLLDTQRTRYARATGGDAAEWAARNAQVLLQCSRLGGERGYGVRDSSMAANIEWILRRSPKGSKIVLWAHNGHVGRGEGSMGEWLAKRFGKDMVVIGFATNEGRYTAMNEGLQSNDLKPGPEGSIESFAKASGLPRFLLDLRTAAADSSLSARLASGITMRSIGAVAMEKQFFPVPIAQRYDVLAWVEKSEATRPIKQKD